MATERIIIQFRADGTRVVQANIKGVGAAAKKASKSTDTLKNALKALIALETARRIIQLADSFTLLQNRIRVLTDSQAGLVRTTQALFETANRTRTSIESNALIFQRLTLATKGLVSGEEGVLEIVETLNKALQISGTTTQEAAAGTIQLAQGFAAGALRGDELRSVMEQLPIIASILEKELGVTRGGLRKLGKEGKITSEILVRAFQNNREEIAEKFGKVIPTISGQFVILRNNIIRMIGDLQDATGLFTGLGSAIRFAADNLEIFAKIAATLAVPVLIAISVALKALVASGGAVAVFFGKFVGAAKLLAGALFSVVGAGAAVITGLIVFRKEIGGAIESLVAEKRELKAVETEVAALNKRLLAIIKTEEDAAEAAAAFSDKLDAQIDVLKDQSKFLLLSVAAQDQFIINAKLLADLKKSGLDLDVKGREELKKSFLAQAKLIQLEREESDLLRKLEGPLVKLNRERATARRLLDLGLGPRQKLLDIDKQISIQNNELIDQLEQETKALRQSTVFGEIDNQIQQAENALKKQGIDLGSIEGKQALERVKIAIEENRAAGIRRQNLRDFNLDQSERFEIEADLANILKENIGNERQRNLIIRELTIEQAKLLVQLNALADFEFDRVIDKTLEPLREQNALLRAESEAIGLSNVEREISISRIAIENALKAKGVDINKANVRTLLEENAAIKRQIDLKQRQKSLEQEFGLDRTDAIEREGDLNNLLATGNLNFDQRVNVMARLNEVTSESTDFFKGLAQAFLEVDTTLLTLGKNIGGILVGAIDSAADAFADFAVEGFQDAKKLQQALSDIFKQIAKDIIKAIIQLIIFKTIQAAFGASSFGAGAAAPGGGGGQALSTAGGGINIVPAQAGAFLQAGQPALVGERGPEPFVPTVSGRVLPNAAIQEPPAPQITIVNVTDPKEVQGFLSTTEGEDVIMNVIQKRQRQVKGLLR